MMKEMSNVDIFNEIREALEGCNTSFDTRGAIVFGSWVKGSATPTSDFDILVAANGINPKLHRRGKEMMQLKRCLPLRPFDILLLTPEETISNFRNHNPLFLDISMEGIILLDRDGLLQKLVDETKRYIREKKIERLNGGWRFPIKYREATYLSRVSNKDFAMAMLNDGERDYLIGKRLMDDGFYDKSVYHFQQSIEKCIKSILISFGVFQKSHFVGAILMDILKQQEISDEWKKKLYRSAELSEEIEPEVSRSRYPGVIEDKLWLPFEEYNRRDAERAGEKAEVVLSIARSFLNYWFPDQEKH
jgi:HEPN domain-containing protein/predicted nucleotidyltransferase